MPLRMGLRSGENEVWFKLMDAVALLHSRGHQRLHVVPTLGDIAPHFFVVLAEDIDYDGDYPQWQHESTVLAYSMADGFQVGGLLVGPDTPVSSVAREILAGATDKGIGIDWAYAGWYAEMLAEARRLGVIPVSYSDFGTPHQPVWRLGYQEEIPFPPPPVTRSRKGFTDAFQQPKIGKSVAPFPIPPHSESLDVTKLDDLTALVASFTKDHDYFMGLFAITPQADYRRKQGAWVRYEKDEEIYEDVLVQVSYRFIKSFDFLEAHGKSPDRNLAERMRLFSGRLSILERDE